MDATLGAPRRIRLMPIPPECRIQDATGDWNGDAEFDSSDLILALQQGDYVAGG